MLEDYEVVPPKPKEKWNASIRFMEMSEVLDSYRLVPRALLLATGYLVWEVTQWFMFLEAPTVEQSALVVTITAIIPAVIGLYQNSGKVKENAKE